MRIVAVLVESSTQYGRDLLQGIARYAQLAGWRLRYEQGGLNRAEPAWLRDWNGDGVITRAGRLRFSPKLAAKGIAVVGCANEPGRPTPDDVPDTDNKAVGVLAAQYFIGKGFPHFAFIGFRDAVYSVEREHGFQAALARAGHKPARVLDTTRAGGRCGEGEEAERQFLLSLPTPCAVLCATDERSAQILGPARECGRTVPEQLSILGVDNDSLLCQLAHPSLSSIDTDAVGIGTALAERLDQLMRGRDPGAAPRIQPLGVVERVSTAWEAVTDPHMIKALSFIRNTAGRRITVEEVARTAGVCRRALEHRFREHFQTSVAAFLRRRMVDSIKHLLLHTDYPLERIAEILGIEHLQQLHALFRRLEGRSPTSYRRNHLPASKEPKA